GIVVNHRADRHWHLDRPALGACPVAALAVTPAFPLVFRIEAEVEQSILVLVRHHDDVAAAPAIAAARAAARDVLLAPKRKTAVAAVASLDQNSYFVDEHKKAARVCFPK